MYIHVPDMNVHPYSRHVCTSMFPSLMYFNILPHTIHSATTFHYTNNKFNTSFIIGYLTSPVNTFQLIHVNYHQTAFLHVYPPCQHGCTSIFGTCIYIQGLYMYPYYVNTFKVIHLNYYIFHMYIH